MNSTPAWVRTFPPEASQGWTISFIERESRYWLEASAGLKAAQLFEQGVQRAWHWARMCLASVYGCHSWQKQERSLR
jgi:hypothetical protein